MSPRELTPLNTATIARVRHDLQTPVVTMQHALALLGDQVAGSLSEEQREFVGVAQRNLQQLTTLLNSLMLFWELEAGRVRLTLEPEPIGPVIQAVCDSLEGVVET